jgi:hypothetical protein
MIKDYESSNYTNFNPLYNSVGITPESLVKTYTERITYNEYEFVDKDGNTKKCFKKFITLVDYVKFLIGKYKNDVLVLPSLENKKDDLFQETIHSPHNYAYVDNCFYYLTSTLKKRGFLHGMEVYDSYICIKNDVEINIADDFEYICDTKFFNDKLNNLFYFKDGTITDILRNKGKETIEISDENIELDIETLEIESLNGSDTEEITEINDNSGSECSVKDSDSELSFTDEEFEEDEYETESEESEEESEMESQELILVIKEMPVQVVSIEKCENTLDSLLEKNDVRMEELESAMFQVIVMLYTYQTIFKFTHNDLHTNNIMYVNTELEFLFYKINGIYYKIPTFGKIYKIIDFGRSIYTVNNKVLCSDSFSENGMAHTQYNFEPFFNPKKPVLEPNYSFDLCRLGCSILDFIIDDLDDIDKFRQIPVYDLIISWIYDDNGKNILYKKNGDDRYPEFKLYKMIARIVHNHTPLKQLDHECFKKYVSVINPNTMDIDELIKS